MFRVFFLFREIDIYMLRNSLKNVFKKNLAGFVARQMGFPVELITVTNPNDIVSRTFKSGDWRMNKDVKATWASAMDIQVNINYYLFMFYTLKYSKLEF